jgi:outer membrane protein assembly factor BamB
MKALRLAAVLLVVASLMWAGRLQPEPDSDDQPRPDVTIDYNANQVVRRDKAGRVRWSSHLDGYLGLVRPPHVLSDNARVYVTHDDGVTALDRNTGMVLWHTQGPADRMCLSGNMLLAVQCGSGEPITTDGRWLTARNTADGAEVFRVQLLVPEHFEPEPIREVAGLFLVQGWGPPSGKHDALLIDRQGQIRHRLDRQVVSGLPQGKDLVLLTSRDIVCLSPHNRTRWPLPWQPGGMADGGLLELADGDLLAFLYGGIWDSGVQVFRFEPGTGRQVWRAYCQSLGVSHSAYSHRATVVVEGERVKVTSRGSGGTFVELLELATGQQVGRTQRLRY